MNLLKFISTSTNRKKIYVIAESAIVISRIFQTLDTAMGIETSQIFNAFVKAH